MPYDGLPLASPTMNASIAGTPSTMASSGRSPNAHANESPHPATPLDHNRTPSTNTNTPPNNQPPASNAPQSFITGPITLDPFATPSATLNPRSCVTCRRRKVRCDKHMPCGNCRKAQIQCVFPAPGRAPRRPRAKDPNAPPKQTSEREMELMKRLRKLEGIVEDLSGQIEFETYKHNANSESPEATSDTLHENELRKATASPTTENVSLPNNVPPGYSVLRRTGTGGSTTGNNLVHAKGQHGADVNKDFGKLVLNEKGKVRYVNNAFWSKITEEVRIFVDTSRPVRADEKNRSKRSVQKPSASRMTPPIRLVTKAPRSRLVRKQINMPTITASFLAIARPASICDHCIRCRRK